MTAPTRGEREDLAEILRAYGDLYLDRAAELLLTPAVGVSREEVERIVNASTVPVGGWIGAPSEVLACVRALPEAQPEPEEGWHYLPELPAEGLLIVFAVAGSGDVPFVCSPVHSSRVGMYQGTYAWHSIKLPAAPPFPKGGA